MNNNKLKEFSQSTEALIARHKTKLSSEMSPNKSKTTKWVIFDLDGTLALIDERRAFSAKSNGKIDWDKFFAPENIQMDKPNNPVIEMAKSLSETGHNIAIFSGRSVATILETKQWLADNGVKFDLIRMRPTNHPFKFMPDEKLKSDWFDEEFPNKSDVLCVFDDRNKVVKMWRDKGISVMHVAEGDF